MDALQHRLRDLQLFATIGQQFMADGVLSLAEAVGTVEARLADHQPEIPKPAQRRRPDNITICHECGHPAVIVRLNDPAKRGTKTEGDFTHAIQCQNRPATDQPWQDGHCGHTEYVVRLR